MTVVDASVFVAIFHHYDVFHIASARWLQQHLRANGRLQAPRLVVAEVAGAIARRTGDPALGHAAVQQLLTLPQLSLLTATDTMTDATAALAAGLRLRGKDALYVAAAAELGGPLVTWDDEQLVRGGRHTVVRRPDQI